MALKVNPNAIGSFAFNKLQESNKTLTSLVEKLSTGRRINRASDDASGLVIADQLASQSRGIGQALRNASDAIAMTQVAEGALGGMAQIVSDIREKALQAANASQSPESRRAIQAEIDKSLESLRNITKNTTYNGQRLLSGSFANRSFQTGASAGETISMTIPSADPSVLGELPPSDMEGQAPAPLSFTSVLTTAADSVTTRESTLAADSTAVAGSTLAAGSTLGANLTAAQVTGDITTSRESAVAAGSLIEAGSTIAAGSTLEGSTLQTDLTLTADITLSGSMTLAGGSQLATGGGRMNLSAGSTLGGAVTLAAGFTTTKATELGTGSTLAAGSTLAGGSTAGGPLTTATPLTAQEPAQLGAGSRLAGGTVLTRGTTLTNDIQVAGGGRLTAGTILQQDAMVAGDQRLDRTMTVAAGSTLAAGSIIAPAGAPGQGAGTAEKTGGSLAGINVLTPEGAQAAIETADAALSQLNGIRTELGARQNQLGSTIANLSVTSVNLNAAESQIADADYAEEAMTLNQAKILFKARIFAQTQTGNLNRESIFNLLQG